ncbi:MAG: AAA family ATPase, partial [Actinomycetota bacterium]
ELVELQLDEDHPPLASLRSDVPDTVSRAIATATSKDPAKRFTTIDEFLAALDDSMSEASPQPTHTSGSEAANPYLGLRAFDSGDADRFFGRESLIADMLDRLAAGGVASRCLLAVGPSGSGKSSVVRAGLLPAVRAGGIDGSDDWFVTTMTPGTDPFDSLEAALLRVAVNPPPSLIEQLRGGSRGVLRGVRRCLPSDDDHLVLVIDQFEELFVGTSADVADEFLDALSTAIDEPTSPLTVVATLRADYYDRPLDHPLFGTIATRSTVQVTRLAADELERAITEPAARLGVGFDAGLVARMIAETVGQASPLPLVQFTLGELFDRRTGDQISTAAYDDLGGVGGALAASAEQIHADATEPRRETIRRVFGELTDAGAQTADLRRRVALADLGDHPDVSWVLERFGAARLITFDRDTSTREPTVEVAHEALLREWPRLTDWLTEDAETLRSVDRIRAAATTWDEAGRQDTDLYRGDRLAQAEELARATPDRLRPLDREFVEVSREASDATRRREERRLRRLRRLVAGTAAALLLALVAGGLAFRSQQRADDAASTAEAEREVADAQREVAEAERAAALDATERAEIATIISRSAALVDDEPDAAILLALEAHRRAPGPTTEQAVLNALGSTSTPNRVASGPAVFEDRDCPPSPSPGALFDLGIIDGRLAVRDNLTGTTTVGGPAPAECVWWVTDADLDRRLATTLDGDRAWVSATRDASFVEIDIDARVAPNGSFTDDGRVVATTDAGAVVFDSLTSEVVGEVTIDGGSMTDWPVVAGDRAALAFEVRLDGEVTGTTLIVDTGTAEVLGRIDTQLPLARLVWDEDRGEIIGARDDGPILTFDAETGELLHTVETDETGFDLADLGLRSDGLLVTISRAQAQLVDRRTGPVGAPVPLDAVFDARVRSDGLIQVVTPDLRFEVIDLDGNALVGRTLATDPFSSTTIVGDRVGVVTVATREAEIIDLASGDRRPVELESADGVPFPVSRLIPADEGVWAVSFDGVVGRWRDGQAVETIDLGGVARAGGDSRNQLALIVETPDGDRVARLVDLVPGGLAVRFTIDAPEAVGARPTNDGGMYVIEDDGVLTRYDAAGSLVARVETDAREASVIATDPGSDRIALADATGVVIVDTVTGEVSELSTAADAANVAFVRNGSLLVVTSADGSVRLWDLEREASAGLVWNGDGSSPIVSDLEFDQDADTIWVPVSGRLIEVPLTAERWIERACDLIGRDLTESEWRRYVPGDGPVQSACL